MSPIHFGDISMSELIAEHGENEIKDCITEKHWAERATTR
jgi:hypothetical protein